MFVVLKFISSTIAVLLITEVAKKYTMLGGLIAMMPINIILSLLWLHFETKDTKLLTEFTSSAIIGIIPTAIFLITIFCLLNKNVKISSSISISLLIWFTLIFFQNKFMGNSF